MRVKVAAIQMAVGKNEADNIARALQQVTVAADAGARIILLQELFSTPYFCKDQNPDFLSLAQPRESHPALLAMQKLAREREVVLPVSFFERANNAIIVISLVPAALAWLQQRLQPSEHPSSR